MTALPELLAKRVRPVMRRRFGILLDDEEVGAEARQRL